MSDLPSLEDCTVVQATAAQMDEMWETERPHFSPSLDSKQYKVYADQFRAAPYARDGKMIGWALVKRDDPQGQAYSYVETILRPAWAKDEKGIRDAVVYALQFVITPKEYRRKGYSYRLLRSVHFLLCPPQNTSPWPTSWGAAPARPTGLTFPRADASYLSSLAPEGFYEGCLIGPDEDKRPGWMSRDNIENAEITWEMRDVEVKTGPKMRYELVYQDQLDGLAGEVSKALKNKLQQESVPPNTTLLRIDPSPPGTLMFIDMHRVVGMDRIEGLIPRSTPIGIRLLPQTDDPTPPFDQHQPLVLFLPQGFHDGELLVTLMLNIDADMLPVVLNALREVCATMKPPCTKLRAWGLAEDDPITKKYQELGAEFEYRSKINFIPHGVAWYGAKGTDCRLDGLEAWAWV